MAFNITVLDKDGTVLDWKTLDAEVCELWGVAIDNEQWCKAPEKSNYPQWHDFLGRCVFLQRAYDSSDNIYTAADFFKGLLEFGRWRPDLENIHANRYEIQLLLYWISKDYFFRVEDSFSKGRVY